MNSTTYPVKLRRPVDCGKVKYLVDCDAQGVSVFEDMDEHHSVVLMVDLPAFHAAAIADAIVVLTREYAEAVAKLKGGEA